MVAALVFLTFAVLIAVGVLLGAAARRARVPAALAAGEAETVEGFELRPGLAYHPRHVWVGRVGRDVVRVGLDDFARRIVGPPDAITLPGTGRELKEGLPVIEMIRAGRTVRLPAPVSGRVVAVNRQVLDEPALAAKEPLGRGWLFEVRLAGAREASPLLRGKRARDWLEGTVNRMRAVLTGSAGLAMTDGGAPVEDMKQVLDDDAWAWLIEWTLGGESDESRR